MKQHCLSLFLIIAFISGCSKPSDTNVSPSATVPVVTTGAVSDLTANSASIACDLVSTGNDAVSGRGVVIGVNPNPDLSSVSYAATGNSAGTYIVSVPNLQQGTTYHARAYAVNSRGTAYGNDIAFATPVNTGAVTTAPTDILITSALFRGSNTSAAGVTIYERGFVYNTNPNPDINNSNVASYHTGGTGTYTFPVTGLQPNTTYYVRAYSYEYGQPVSYGAELTFKTTGYNGPTGGLVFYDKGETTNGWRYMEVSPIDITYGGGSTSLPWGCAGTIITQTNSGYGDGKDNTDRIIAGCNTAYAAARLCKNSSFGGATDWFLPSQKEGLAMFDCLEKLNAATGSYYWTSTEANANDAYEVYGGGTNVTSGTFAKSQLISVRAVRRY